MKLYRARQIARAVTRVEGGHGGAMLPPARAAPPGAQGRRGKGAEGLGIGGVGDRRTWAHSGRRARGTATFTGARAKRALDSAAPRVLHRERVARAAGTWYATPMPDSHSLLLFVGAGLLLNLTPGPDLLYILGRSMSQGRAAGVISAIGIGAGCVVHVLGAALGLSALLLALPRAYDVVPLAGAAYLVVLGVKALRSTAGTLEVKALAPLYGASSSRARSERAEPQGRPVLPGLSPPVRHVRRAGRSRRSSSCSA